MPYIKQMWRPEYRLVIMTARYDVEKAIEYLGICLKNRKPEKVDGCINYLFTQILRNNIAITPKEGQFIRGAIIELYAKPLTYNKINRFNGLITSMMDEFVERGWDNPENMTFLFRVRLLYKNTFTRDYEKRKREENGDLEEII